MNKVLLIALILIFFCLLLIIIILIQNPKLEGGISFLMNENNKFRLQSKNILFEKLTWYITICIFILIYILNLFLINK